MLRPLLVPRLLPALVAFTVIRSAFAAECGSLLVSVPEQRIYAFDTDGFKLASYPVSTSKFGLGDIPNSYATPLGMLAIGDKYGHNAPLGAVFKHCQQTGEIVPPNSPGRDPIVTRIMTLRGLEPQNAKASARGVFIHGTPEERNIGKPASYGCIRLKSRDVIELFNQARSGNRIQITTERVGRFFDRFSRLIAPIGRLMPPVGRFLNKTGNTVNRIVDPIDKILPVAKILDGVDRGLLVHVDKAAVFAKSKLNGRQKPGTEDKANASAAAQRLLSSSRMRR